MSKIQSSLQGQFSVKGEENYYWNMYKAWEKGISPKEFRSCRSQDIKDLLDIENTVFEKNKAEAEINKKMEEF